MYYVSMNTEVAGLPMRATLESEARNLRQMHGAVYARHFTLNPNAGTIRDIRDGSIIAWILPEWVPMTEEYLRQRLIRTGNANGHTVTC